MPVKVNEIFYSIQGESSYAGRPCVFVRLSGCNLRCSYCDTAYAYEEGEWLEIADVLNRVRSFGCALVEITGGEPLLQADTPVLARTFLDNGLAVLVETNGSCDISLIDERCIRIIDVKCPSSGESDKNRLDNLDCLTDRDEIKFVIGGREDYDFAADVLASRPFLCKRTKRPLFSPVFGRMPVHVLAGWILADHLDVCLQIQLHKVIWEPDRRGV